MKRQPYPVVQLTGGLDVGVDATFLVDRNSPNLKEARFDKGLIKKEFEWIDFGTVGAGALPLDSDVMAMPTFNMYDGSSISLAVTQTKIYKYVTGGTFTDITGTTPLTGDLDNRISSVSTLNGVGADIFLLTNGKDIMQAWSGTGDFADWGGTATIIAKCLTVFKSRLIMGHTVESGVSCTKRIRWTVAGDVEDDAGAGSGFVDIADAEGNFVCFALLKDKLFLIFEKSIWELVYVGGTRIFDPQLRVSGFGSYSPDGVVAADGKAYIYGNTSIATYDGLDVVPIDQQVHPLFYLTEHKIINSSMAQRAAMAYSDEAQEIWLAVCTHGSTVPDKLFKYNLLYNSWILYEREATSFGAYLSASGGSWLDESTTIWSARTGVWKEVAFPSGSGVPLIGLSNGYIKQDDRSTYGTRQFEFESKDWMFGHATRVVEFRVQARLGAFTITYSIDEGATFLGGRSFAAQSEFTEFSYPVNFTAQKVRVRIVSSSSQMEIKWIEPWHIPRKRSSTLQMS